MLFLFFQTHLSTQETSKASFSNHNGANVNLMFQTFFKSLACLALQKETIVKKITQPKLPKTKNEVTKIGNEPGTSGNELCLCNL